MYSSVKGYFELLSTTFSEQTSENCNEPFLCRMQCGAICLKYFFDTVTFVNLSKIHVEGETSSGLFQTCRELIMLLTKGFAVFQLSANLLQTGFLLLASPYF